MSALRKEISHGAFSDGVNLDSPLQSFGSRATRPSQTNGLAHDLLEISMGPHHPSTHGVFRMDVIVDGEEIVQLKPVFGYLHRNHEKLAEKNSYLGIIPYTDRLDYICSMTNNWAYVLAVEKLVGFQPTERAEYIRVIVSELTRLFNHACLVGFLPQDMGAMGTPLMYAFREREKILRPVRITDRLAHDVQLHAFRRCALRFARRLVG